MLENYALFNTGSPEFSELRNMVQTAILIIDEASKNWPAKGNGILNLNL